MVNGLDAWLNRAARSLAKDAAAEVRSEIREHYDSAREAALHRGVTEEEADRIALHALGDPAAANRQYRKVFLTATESRLLRDSNWEAKAVCSNVVVKTVLALLPLVTLGAAVMLFRIGANEVARVVLAAAIGTGLIFIAPLLPVYTPWRGRIVRYAKWLAIGGLPFFALGPDSLKYSWLVFPSSWMLVWVEWQRMSIRRKLPLAQWPRHLYL